MKKSNPDTTPRIGKNWIGNRIPNLWVWDPKLEPSEGSEIKSQERIRKSESKSLDLESEMGPKTDRKSGPKTTPDSGRKKLQNGPFLAYFRPANFEKVQS